jgi:hypothetical protein
LNCHRALWFCSSMISAQKRRVCAREDRSALSCSPDPS